MCAIYSKKAVHYIDISYNELFFRQRADTRFRNFFLPVRRLFRMLGRCAMRGHDIYICISFIVSPGKRLHAANIPQDSLYIQIALSCCPAKLRPERFDMREP